MRYILGGNMNEPKEAVQCKGCEKFALLVKQKNNRIKELEKLIQRAIDAKMWTSNHACWVQLYDDLQKALEDKGYSRKTNEGKEEDK